LLSRSFVVLWVAMLVAMAGISMVSPLLPVYVQDDLGGPAIGVALSFSGLAIAQIIFAPFVGRLGDKFGPKRFIVVGFAIYAMGAIGYLFATRWEVVVAFRVLSGVGAAGIFPMSLAYVGRLAPVGREGRYMGWFSVSQIAGFGLGPLFGGGLRDAFGSDVAFASMAIMLGGTALVTMVMLPRRPRRRGDLVDIPDDDTPQLGFIQIIRRPAVQASTLFVTLTSMGWGSASAWLAVYVISDQGLGTDSALFVGILLSSRSLINAVLQPLTGALADRVNRVALVTVGLAVSGVAQFVIPLVPEALHETTFLGPAMVVAPWVLVAMLAAGIGEAVAQPSQQAVFVEVGRRVGMGSLMGLNSMGSSLGFLGGSLLGALVKSQLGIEYVFYMAGTASIVGLVAFNLLMRRARNDFFDPTSDLTSEDSGGDLGTAPVLVVPAG
jgi:MFS transporter, DHA1 family, multidrug resistance protein